MTTLFHLASVSKPFVATAVMRYVDEARLDLGAPLERYLPQMAGTDAGTVTTAQVMTHTSVLPDMSIESIYGIARSWIASNSAQSVWSQIALGHAVVRNVLRHPSRGDE